MARPRLQIYMDQEVLDRLKLAASESRLDVTDWAAAILQLEADRVLDKIDRPLSVHDFADKLVKILKENHNHE